MSKITGEINKKLQPFGFQIKKYERQNFKWVKDLSIKTIIDVGANVGQFAVEYSKIIPNAKIYSFEPVKKCYEELLQNTMGLNIECFNVGLGEIEDEYEINVYNHSPSSSILEMNELHEILYPHSKGGINEKIKIKRLDDMIRLDDNFKNILLKVDVQGFEDKVLKGALETLKSVKVILIEMSYIELYKGQPLFEDIYSILYKSGFTFKGNLSQSINKNDGTIVYSDSIFILKD